MKLPTVDKRLSEKQASKGLLKVKSGKLPILNVHTSLPRKIINIMPYLRWKDAQVE